MFTSSVYSIASQVQDIFNLDTVLVLTFNDKGTAGDSVAVHEFLPVVGIDCVGPATGWHEGIWKTER